MNLITPQEFADALDKIGSSSHPETVGPRRIIKEFFQSATARQLSEGLNLRKVKSPFNATDIDEAYNLLNIRLQEESAQAAERHIKQTEELNRLTSSHIEHSETLTVQTDILVNESKKLGRLTWALIWLTVVLAILTAGLLYIDCHREIEAIKP